jgi:hypothetical protein
MVTTPNKAGSVGSVISPTVTSTNIEIPPFYTNQESIETWLLDIFNGVFGLPCVCGDQLYGVDLNIVRPRIVRICQREDTPCIIEIDFHLGTANGLYIYRPDLSGYSIDTTDGVDGIWHQLRPDTSDANHNPSPNNTTLAHTNTVDATWNYASFNPANPLHGSSCDPNIGFFGIPVHKFVFDMCQHINTWFSEISMSFRLTFDKAGIGQPGTRSCSISVF